MPTKLIEIVFVGILPFLFFGPIIWILLSAVESVGRRIIFGLIAFILPFPVCLFAFIIIGSVSPSGIHSDFVVWAFIVPTIVPLIVAICFFRITQNERRA